ncbi:hypothetical protein [Cohnella massiliensis]|uniref:hypothetical protein n=1 Tax=Cohnella massiliensis TaxID=1816691 RepID=UPI0009BAED48|nr:hypothetical protein [Cohnella massiliensis]
MNESVPYRKKRKWLAGLLAMFVPGIGHMYLGLMQKGVAIMMLLALNICGIVFVSMEFGDNVLSIVLLSLLIPIIYFYNLFDALQSAEMVNDRSAAGPAGYGWPGENGWNGLPPAAAEAKQAYQAPKATAGGTGLILLAAGGLVLLASIGFEWPRKLMTEGGSLMGGAILIGCGVYLWFRERRVRADGRD